jgi:surface protein
MRAILASTTIVLSLIIWVVFSNSILAQTSAREFFLWLKSSPILGLSLIVIPIFLASVLYVYIDFINASEQKKRIQLNRGLIKHGKTKAVTILKKDWKRVAKWSAWISLSLAALVGVAILSSGATRAYAPNEFVTTWKTDNPGTGPGGTANNQIRIPTTGLGYNYNVAWEEVGNPANNGMDGPFTSSALITFPYPGTYEVRITGAFPRIYFNNGVQRQKILTVEQWGSNQWLSMERAFYGANNLRINATDAPNLSGVTNLDWMFKGATSLNDSLNHWDVSNVTRINELFFNATSFNQPLNNWNVSSVTEMYTVFYGATSFNQPLNNWNVSSVTAAYGMFSNASSFNQPLDNWDVSSMATMQFMFDQASSFNQSLGAWNMSNVTNVIGMLNESGLSVENYDSTVTGWAIQPLGNGLSFGALSLRFCNSVAERQSIIDNYNWTFFGDLEYCPASPDEFVTTWKTDNPGASNSNQIIIPTAGTGYSYNVDWREVANPGGNNGTAGPFTASTTITFPSDGIYEVRISGDFPRICFAIGGLGCNNGGDRQKILTVEQWGSNPWLTFENAFYGASNLSIPASDAPNLTSTNNLVNMFSGATSFNSPINHWNVENISNMSGMFYNATSFNQPLNNWNVSNVTNMSGMFIGSTSFNSSINSWNTANVTVMANMFYNATSFNQPLNNWNVSNVTLMQGMFSEATSFNQPLNNWNVSSATAMFDMFRGATAFNQNINNWNVSNVNSMTGMFAYATSFNQPLNNWNLSGLSDNHFALRQMFMGATSFNQDISSWDVSGVKDFSSMFFGATSFNQSLGNWDVSDSLTSSNMLSNTALSTENYDDTLIGWATQNLQNNVVFGAAPATYCLSADQRAYMISNFSWNITDGGLSCVGLAKEVNTENPDVIDSSTAKLNGSVSGPGLINFTSGGFQWGLISDALADEVANLTIASQNFSHQVNLECDTQYFYRAFAVDGGDVRTYGLVTTFTIPCPIIEEPENVAPTIQITSPQNGQEFSEGSDVSISAEAYDDNEVAEVRFYINGELLTSLQEIPYDYLFEDPEVGTYSLVAVAEDDEGLETGTQPVIFTVVAVPGQDPQRPPEVQDPQTPLVPRAGALALGTFGITLALIFLYINYRKNKKIMSESDR